MKKQTKFWRLLGSIAGFAAGQMLAQPAAPQPLRAMLPSAPPLTETPVLEIKVDQVKAKSSPILYGLMTENINYCYDGGLYAEQIRNRNFKEVPRPRGGRGQTAPNPNAPRTDGLAFWSLVQTNGGVGKMEADKSSPMNSAQTTSLKLTIENVAADQHVGVSNEGYWGMAVRPRTQYRAAIWAKAGDGFTGPLTLALVSADGKTVYAQTQIRKLSDSYKKYEASLVTDANVPETKDACFQIWVGNKGTVWLGLVSLFPPTYKSHGLRVDMMKLMADMNVKFLRFPGGNYIEGSSFATRFNWKETVGDISERPGHENQAWGYWSSDGMGLMEFLRWCEDIGMEPVLGVYAGFSLGGRDTIAAGEPLKPFVQEALDEIEYVTGDVGTKWGAQRAKDGHPKPFKLNYVEIGNEENLGRSGYEARYVQFRDAIKAKHPHLQIISAVAEAPKLGDVVPDVQDDHHYMSPPGMLGMWNKYDSYDRKSSPALFLGEWATRLNNGSPLTPNLEYGLCDGVAAIQFERNSDLIRMQCYAPIFVNVNPGANQWTCNLIGYDVLNTYGGASYHVLKLFGSNKGDAILTADVPSMPTWEVPMRGPGIAATDPRMRTVPRFYYDATRDSATGTIYVKVVNPANAPLPVHVKITGVRSIDAKGLFGEVKGSDPLDLNTITDREKIIATTTKADGFSADFTRTFAPYSASVLVLKGK